MSEGHEPITAELRRVMNHTTMAGVPLVEIGEFEFGHRCDEIDAIHAQLELENAALKASAEQDRDGWVRLPLDADGVPIRVGDVMEGTCPSGKHVNGTVNAIGEGVFWISNVQFSLKPDYMHHYHAPTVEDVLRELLDEAEHFHSLEEERDAISEYAKRLTLAGDAS